MLTGLPGSALPAPASLHLYYHVILQCCLRYPVVYAAATEFQPNPPGHLTLTSDDDRLLDNEEDEAGPEPGGGLELQDCSQGSPVPRGVGRMEDTLIYGDDDEVQVELSEDGIRAMNLTITVSETVQPSGDPDSISEQQQTCNAAQQQSNCGGKIMTRSGK